MFEKQWEEIQDFCKENYPWLLVAGATAALSVFIYHFYIKRKNFHERVKQSLDKESRNLDEKLQEAEKKGASMSEALVARSKELSTIERENETKIKNLYEETKRLGVTVSITKGDKLSWEQRAERTMSMRLKGKEDDKKQYASLDNTEITFFSSTATLSSRTTNTLSTPSDFAIINAKKQENKSVQQTLIEHEANMDASRKLLEESEKIIIKYQSSVDQAKQMHSS